MEIAFTVAAVVAVATGVPISNQCFDLVADCGAVADGRDVTTSFATCQRKAEIQGFKTTTEPNKSPGCITIPALQFRCMNVAITTSHITWYIAEGAVFSPPRGMTKSSAMFSVGAQGSVNKPDPGDSGTVQNISIVGGWPGRFTVNISEPLTGGLAGQRQVPWARFWVHPVQPQRTSARRAQQRNCERSRVQRFFGKG